MDVGVWELGVRGVRESISFFFINKQKFFVKLHCIQKKETKEQKVFAAAIRVCVPQESFSS